MMGMFDFNKSVGEKRVDMQANDILSFEEKELWIMCVEGLLWITSEDGTERMVPKGQSVKVSSKGKTCVLAFLRSRVHIYGNRRTRLYYIHSGKKIMLRTVPICKPFAQGISFSNL